MAHFRSKRGLNNLGNTCYMNSAIQAINTCEGFKQKVLQSKKPHNAQKVTIQLRRLFHELGQSNRSPHSPASFARTARPPWFSPGQQQDSSEFLRHLLNELHEEENSQLRFDLKRDDNLPKTMVEETFGIGLTNTYECLKCHYKLEAPETRLDLVLPLPKGKKSRSGAVPLGKLIDDFQEPERMDGNRKYYCDRCCIETTTNRTATITRYPEYLIVNLARFLYIPETNSQSKNMTVVNHPKHFDFHVEETGHGHNNRSRRGISSRESYTLKAIVVHSGMSSNSGHYYCFGTDSSGSWFNFNDTSVSSMNKNFNFEERNGGGATACVLIYANDKSSGSWSTSVDVPQDLLDYQNQESKENDDLEKWNAEKEDHGRMDHGMNQPARKKKDISEEFNDGQVRRMVKNCKTSQELLKKAEMFAHVDDPIVQERLAVLEKQEEALNSRSEEKSPKKSTKTVQPKNEPNHKDTEEEVQNRLENLNIMDETPNVHQPKKQQSVEGPASDTSKKDYKLQEDKPSTSGDQTIKLSGQYNDVNDSQQTDRQVNKPPNRDSEAEPTITNQIHIKGNPADPANREETKFTTTTVIHLQGENPIPNHPQTTNVTLTRPNLHQKPGPGQNIAENVNGSNHTQSNHIGQEPGPSHGKHTYSDDNNSGLSQQNINLSINKATYNAEEYQGATVSGQNIPVNTHIRFDDETGQQQYKPDRNDGASGSDRKIVKDGLAGILPNDNLKPVTSDINRADREQNRFVEDTTTGETRVNDVKWPDTSDRQGNEEAKNVSSHQSHDSPVSGNEGPPSKKLKNTPCTDDNTVARKDDCKRKRHGSDETSSPKDNEGNKNDSSAYKTAKNNETKTEGSSSSSSKGKQNNKEGSGSKSQTTKFEAESSSDHNKWRWIPQKNVQTAKSNYACVIS